MRSPPLFFALVGALRVLRFCRGIWGVAVNEDRAPMAPLQRDPRFMRAAHRYGLVDYWRRTDR